MIQLSRLTNQCKAYSAFQVSTDAFYRVKRNIFCLFRDYSYYVTPQPANCPTCNSIMAPTITDFQPGPQTAMALQPQMNSTSHTPVEVAGYNPAVPMMGQHMFFPPPMASPDSATMPDDVTGSCSLPVYPGSSSSMMVYRVPQVITTNNASLESGNPLYVQTSLPQITPARYTDNNGNFGVRVSLPRPIPIMLTPSGQTQPQDFFARQQLITTGSCMPNSMQHSVRPTYDPRIHSQIMPLQDYPQMEPLPFGYPRYPLPAPGSLPEMTSVVSAGQPQHSGCVTSFVGPPQPYYLAIVPTEKDQCLTQE